jgi:hypothetical protein
MLRCIQHLIRMRQQIGTRDFQDRLQQHLHLNTRRAGILAQCGFQLDFVLRLKGREIALHVNGHNKNGLCKVSEIDDSEVGWKTARCRPFDCCFVWVDAYALLHHLLNIPPAEIAST